jgi:hypothetical protein
MAGIKLDLVIKPFSVTHFYGPSSVEFGDKMLAFGMVDTVSLPAHVKVSS